MSHNVKVAGVWRKADPYVRVAGVWKLCDYVYGRVGGLWYTSFVRGGLIDRSWFDMGLVGTGANNYVNAIAVQSDGKILVGGNFSAWNGTTVGCIVRLNSDGTRDTTFTTNNGTGANDNVSAIAVQSDNKILVGGRFTAWNGTTVGSIVRIGGEKA